MTNVKEYNIQWQLTGRNKIFEIGLIGIVSFSAFFFPSSLSKVDTAVVAICKNILTGKTYLVS